MRIAIAVYLAAGSLLVSSASALAADSPYAWKTLGTISAFVTDLSFVSGTKGFAAGGNGQILKTTDGAKTWAPVLTSVYPYYWNGVQALNKNDVVIIGEINSQQPQAVMRWSHDGGDTWSDDLIVSNSAIGNRVYFWNSSTGFATQFSGGYGFRTTNGGLQPADWSKATIDPSNGWFGAQFSALSNGHIRISGINYCASMDFAASWSCRPSIDSVSDYATFFLDDKNGWVAGGAGMGVPTGSPPVFEGWLHRTTDGGATWSGRTLDGPWPLRAVIFVNPRVGWAAGGGGSFGGIYVTHDGGLSWQVELDAGFGPQVCATADHHIFCAGYDDNGISHFYSRDYDHIHVSEFD